MQHVMRKLAALLALAALCLPVSRALAEPDKSVVSVEFTKKKVMVKRESGVTVATNKVELPLAILVKTNGVFTVKNGKERRFREGQVLGADGMLTSPDGTVVPVIDHLVLKQGRLMQVKDGESLPVTGEVALGDG